MRRRLRGRRPLLYLALMAMLLVAGDRIGAALLQPLVARSHFRLSALYRGGIEADVVVIGNSRAVHAIGDDEMGSLLGGRVVNIGYNGLSAELSSAVAEDYLDRNAPPRVALIEVSNFVGTDGPLSEMRLYATPGTHLRAFLEKAAPATLLWTRLSHLYRYNDELALRALAYLRRDDRDWEMAGEKMTPEVAARLEPEQDATRFRPDGVAMLRALIARLRAANAEPVLFIAPFHPRHQELVPDYPALVARLQAALGPADPILDMSTMLATDDDFADLVHINGAGGRLVMAALADRIGERLAARAAPHAPGTSTAAAAAAAR